ncbi:MAG: hypothetical protein WA973_18055 [Mesorhizobium sp.]
MSQFDYGTIDPTTKSGSALAGDLNSFRDALHSTHKGPAAPSYAVAGLHWIDDTGDPIWLLKVFDGADWIVEAVIDTTNNVSYPVSVNPVLAYPTAGGSANALTLTPTIPMTSYANGAKVTFTAASNNSGAVTLNVSGVGAKAIRTLAGGADIALVAGNLQAGRKYEVVYSSTANSGAGAWVLVAPPIGTTAGTVPAGDDARLSDEREWTAATVSQAEAEAGTATTRRAWTAERVGQAVKALAPTVPHSNEVFTASGTWTKPAGLPPDALIRVQVWGGGGGGGGRKGGGGGGYSEGVFLASSLSSTVIVTVGAGGANASTGANGGTSKFGEYVAASGGIGGSNSADAILTKGGGPINKDDHAVPTVPYLTSAGGYGGEAMGDYSGGFGGANGNGDGPGYDAVFGGGGGSTGNAARGFSVFGGNGSPNQATPAEAPGGGGHGNQRNDGARGEVRVWIY